MGVIPVALLALLLIVSPSSKDKSDAKMPEKGVKNVTVYQDKVPSPPEPVKKKTVVATPKEEKKPEPVKEPVAVQTDVENPEDEFGLDYDVIYTYITTHFKRVSIEDARSVATSLVEYGQKHGVDPKFAAALMARESAFNKEAISVTGAKGLGQIKEFNYPSLNITDPYDIGQNAQGTVRYLKEMLDGWKGKTEKVSLALASYYKGKTAISRQNEQLDQKTQGYVDDIMNNYEKLKSMKLNLERNQKNVSAQRS